MVEAQVLLLPFPVQSDHHFHQMNYLALNPNAPEFYPFYYITPPNYNTTIITTSFHILPDYYCSPDHYYPCYSHPPLTPPFSVPPPPPPTVQLPHHHFHHHNVNFQEYPSSYFTPIDHQPQIPHSSNPTHYHHNYQYNLSSNPNDITMQPQPLPKPQLAGPGHIRGPVSTRSRPKRVYFHNDHHRATVAVADGVRREPSSGSDGNKGEKEGLINSKEDDDDDQGRVLLGRREKLTELMAVKPGGSETTAMIRNIPNQYTRAMLVKFLDEFCNKENQKLKEATDDHHPPLFAYDFLYLPMDFKTNANKGYAFVNFTHPSAVWKLHLACSDRAWEYCQSPKICQIAYASVQGKQKLVKHFGQTIFICSHEEYLPVCFSPPRDGSGVPVKLTTVGIRFSLSSNHHRMTSLSV